MCLVCWFVLGCCFVVQRACVCVLARPFIELKLAGGAAAAAAEEDDERFLW